MSRAAVLTTTEDDLLAAEIVALRRSRRRLWLLAGLVVLILGLLGGLSLVAARRAEPQHRSTLPMGPASPSGRGSTIVPPRTLSDFTLTSQTGEPLALSTLRSKVVLLFFGYTSCPNICPTTLFEFKETRRLLGGASGEVAIIFISVDPDRDTLSVLARYVGAFDPTFIGLQGEPATLRRVGPEYDLVYQRRTEPGVEGYTMDHTAIAYLLDQQGLLQVVFPYGTPASALATDIRALLTRP